MGRGHARPLASKPGMATTSPYFSDRPYEERTRPTHTKHVNLTCDVFTEHDFTPSWARAQGPGRRGGLALRSRPCGSLRWFQAGTGFRCHSHICRPPNLARHPQTKTPCAR